MKQLRKSTYFERAQMALAVLCTEAPPMKLVREWYLEESDDLTDWVGTHLRPDLGSWAQCIGIVDAATALADAPEEGRPELMHLTLEESLAAEATS